MIEVRVLQRFDSAELRRIGPGYTSREKYAVSRRECAERTAIELELVRLATPYVKVWSPLSEDEEAMYARAVKQGLSRAAFAEREMVAVAIAERMDWNGTLWVWDFHVVKQRQRQGIGRRMMAALEDAARGTGLRIITCETQNTNVGAIRFYRAVGFELEGVDLSCYGNDDVENGEVAIYMKKKLT